MKQTGTRLHAIDTLRGVTILEMLAAHFAGYFPKPVELAIVYTETAMALFVLLAGFMVGWRVIAFGDRPGAVSRDLWRRAARVLAVQVLLVLTAGVVVYVAGLGDVAKTQSFAKYMAESLLLANQVPLIHILPTFLPLFMLAPIMLYAIAAGHELLLLGVSATLFVAGHYQPHLLGYGTPAIFPFVLFQLYFVVGGIAGSRARRVGMIEPTDAMRYLGMATITLVLTMAWVHLKFLPAGTLSTHPLNLYGLIYHAPLIAVIVFGVLAFQPYIARWRVSEPVARFGRHALLAFVLHVYCAILLQVANAWTPLPMAANLLAIAASIVVMNFALARYEAARDAPVEPRWVRGTTALFG